MAYRTGSILEVAFVGVWQPIGGTMMFHQNYRYYRFASTTMQSECCFLDCSWYTHLFLLMQHPDNNSASISVPYGVSVLSHNKTRHETETKQNTAVLSFRIIATRPRRYTILTTDSASFIPHDGSSWKVHFVTVTNSISRRRRRRPITICRSK